MYKTDSIRILLRQNKFIPLATYATKSVIYRKRTLTMCLKNISFILICILFVACHQDFETEPKVEQNTEDPQVIITTEITGQVLDASGNVQDDYIMDIGLNQVVQNKRYFLEAVEAVNKKGQYIELTQADAFKGFALPLLIENDVNVLNLRFFPELESMRVDLNQNQKITPNVNILISSLKNGAGEKHTSAFNLGIRDLSDENYDWQLGSFGYDKLNSLVSLKPIQRFYFELKDDNDNSLEIDPDSPSRLTYGGVTMHSIGLFLLDNDSKKWKLITDINNSIAQIIDDGYYMLAEYEAGIFTEGHLLLDGEAISYQKFRWQNPMTETEGFTSVSGKFLSVVPSNSVLIYNVIDPCNTSLRTIDYDSPDQNADDILFHIENTDGEFFNLDASILSCDEELNNQPAVNMFLDNGNYIYAFNGTDINTWLSVCSNEFEIAGYNIEEDSSGPTISWSTQTEEAIEYLSDCESHLDGFSFLKIRQDKKLYPSFEFSRVGNTTILEADGGEMKLIIQGAEIGQYNVEQLNIRINDDNFGDDGYAVNCENSSEGCGINEAYISHYEEMDSGWIRMTFSGEVWMQTITPAAAGNFPIEGTILCKAN